GRLRPGRGLPFCRGRPGTLGADGSVQLLEDEPTRDGERPGSVSEGEDEPHPLLCLEPRGVRGAEVLPRRRGPPEDARLCVRHDEVVRRTSVPFLCGPISLPPDQVRHLPLLERVRQRERPPRAGDPEIYAKGAPR